MGVLIQPDELNSRLGDERLRVIDMRWYLGRPGAGRTAYDEGHIPSAIFADLDADLADQDGFGAPGRHPLPSAQAFARRLGDLGVGSDDFVVVYDDMGGTIAARLWWMLDNLGHRGGVAILDGGIQAWTAGGYQLTQEQPDVGPQTLDLADDWRNLIERDELASRLGAVTLIDGRAGERYRGEVEPIDPVAGHIPTALNLPVSDNVDATGRFRSGEELRARYGMIVDGGETVVVSCGSGVTGCHSALAMRLAGLDDPILYVGSFSDWSRSGMPVATGADAGDMPKI